MNAKNLNEFQTNQCRKLNFEVIKSAYQAGVEYSSFEYKYEYATFEIIEYEYSSTF